MYMRAFSVLLLAISFTPGLADDANRTDQVNPLLCPNLSFSQLDIDFDGHISRNSDWGSVDLNFWGSSGILYFNLAVQNPQTLKKRWQVRNVPVLSREGVGVCQTLSFNFDLGVAAGTDIHDLFYGSDLTSSILSQMPDVISTAKVEDLPYVIDSGFENRRIRLARAAPLVGGAVAAGETGAWHDFPNQDCGKNECTPAAVSNSLMFLNDKNTLGINANELTIAKMKQATKWQPDGTDQNGWFTFKAAYMTAKGFPITTTTVNPTNPAAVETAIRGGCDVELSTNSHTAAIVGIVRQANGNYSVDVAHDTQQGKPGGTKVEKVDFNPKTTKLRGGAWLDDTNVKHFVVECPTPRT